MKFNEISTKEDKLQLLRDRKHLNQHSFRCYKSKFEKLVPVKVISSSAIECNKAKDSFCPKAVSFGRSMMLCRCPLRKYVALELGR